MIGNLARSSALLLSKGANIHAFFVLQHSRFAQALGMKLGGLQAEPCERSRTIRLCGSAALIGSDLYSGGVITVAGCYVLNLQPSSG